MRTDSVKRCDLAMAFILQDPHKPHGCGRKGKKGCYCQFPVELCGGAKTAEDTDKTARVSTPYLTGTVLVHSNFSVAVHENDNNKIIIILKKSQTQQKTFGIFLA